ncbi:unnamed protein product, partial [Choristocarpus tenellus]
MRRRGVGVGAVKRKEKDTQAFEAVGKKAAEENLAHISDMMDTFKGSLEDFARKYKKNINQDPAFRQQFQVMCTSIGVDPLASTKGFWAEVLGVGDFYYELAVQIVEICINTRSVNGGLMSLPELLQRLQAKGRERRHQPELSQDDVRRATSKLAVLGSGFQILEVGKTAMVVSVPRELSRDHSSILLLAEATGRVTEAEVVERLGWDRDRARGVLRELIQEGMAWVDGDGAGPEGGGGEGKPAYYFPSLWQGEGLL